MNWNEIKEEGYYWLIEENLKQIVLVEKFDNELVVWHIANGVEWALSEYKNGKFFGPLKLKDYDD